jgi:hypothetical protein
MIRSALVLLLRNVAVGLHILNGDFESRLASVPFLPDVDELERDRLSLEIFGGNGELARQGKVSCSLNDAHFFTDNDCSIFSSETACHAARAKVTYLDTFPCVGNTWTRVMLEVVTRIRTGAVFDDALLREAGLLGEGVRDASRVIAVKSHAPIFGDAPGNPGVPNGEYRAIVIARQPLAAALSYTSFRNGGGHATEIPYERLHAAFKGGLKGMLQAWVKFYSTWKSQDDVLVLKYENIVADTRGTYLTHILPFLGVNPENPDIIARIDCAINSANENHGTHRNHSYTYEFDDEDRALAQRYAGEVARSLGYVL